MKCELVLSEVKSRFRIRNGEIEIEYEGPLKDVNEHYEDAFEWLTTRQTKRREKQKEKVEEEEGKKKGKRGGARKPIYPPEIQRLKDDNFFETKKSLDEVVKAFESRGVPTRGKRVAIRNALVRDTRKKDSSLKATKEDDTWVFWVD